MFNTVCGSLIPDAPCMRLTMYVAIQSPFNIAVPTFKKQYNIIYIFHTFSNYNQVLKVRPTNYIKFPEVKSSGRMCMALSIKLYKSPPDL